MRYELYSNSSLLVHLSDQCKGEFFDTYSYLTSYISLSGHFCETEALIEVNQVHFHDEIIARSYGRLPSHAVYSCKEENFLFLRLLRDRGRERNDAAKLSHGFNHEHTWHNRPIRKMTSELRLVGSYALDSHCPLSRLKFHHLINEEEGITMGKDLRNLLIGNYCICVSIVCKTLLETS